MVQQANNIVDITTENVRDVLLEQSKDKVILIDFWADWCEPCKQLTPTLEKIAADFPDTLILAKVNCETEQALAQQFGIQSLPTIVVFKDGQPVDGLGGAQPESAIREMLSKYLPQPEDDALEKARAAIDAQDYETAYTEAKQARDINPESTEARLMLADAASRIGHTEQAKDLLQGLTMADQGSYYQQILASVEMAEQAADSPEIKALEKQVKDDPENLELTEKLALQYHQAKRHEEALELLFSALKKDLNTGDMRKHALDIINNLPAGDPLASKYRRKLYSMLY